MKDAGIQKIEKLIAKSPGLQEIDETVSVMLSEKGLSYMRQHGHRQSFEVRSPPGCDMPDNYRQALILLIKIRAHDLNLELPTGLKFEIEFKERKDDRIIFTFTNRGLH